MWPELGGHDEPVALLVDPKSPPQWDHGAAEGVGHEYQGAHRSEHGAYSGQPDTKPNSLGRRDSNPRPLPWQDAEAACLAIRGRMEWRPACGNAWATPLFVC